MIILPHPDEDVEIDYIEEMAWRELMEEPPGGVNHGRRKDSRGRWLSIDVEETSSWDAGLTVPALTRHRHRSPSRPSGTIQHGTRSAYTTNRCRCEECREANAAYHREYRKRNSTR